MASAEKSPEQKIAQDVTDVINVMTSVGDTLKKSWEKNLDLDTIKTAISAYGKAVGAARGLLIYNHDQGYHTKIPFFEGNNK